MLQNVLFTYFIGLLMLLFVRALNSISEILSLVPTVLAGFACFFLKTDYWLEGIILIYIYYMFRYDLNAKCLIMLIVTFLMSAQHYYGFGVLSVLFVYFYDINYTNRIV